MDTLRERHSKGPGLLYGPSNVGLTSWKTIDVAVLTISFLGRLFSIQSKFHEQKSAIWQSNLIAVEKNDSPLSLIPVLFFRTLVWTQSFPVSCINGINDLVPAENIRYLRNCFSQMMHYYC